MSAEVSEERRVDYKLLGKRMNFIDLIEKSHKSKYIFFVIF